MIKLIACDLDGTLLPPSKIMPPETFPYIRRLADKGVIFAPASGRQLPNLKKLFAPVADKIAIIAENGGLVWFGDKIIYSDPTPSEGVKYALDIIRRQEGLYPLLSCADCAYYESDCEKFIATVNRSYSSAKKVENLNEIAAREVVLKISVWDEQPCAEHGGVILPPLIDGLRTMISGYDWLDVSVSHANKGRALEALMRELGLRKEECAAFGDHMNDLEMLLAAGKAYVTANAYPPLKEKVGEVILSNAEFGVIRKLEELL
ncbi:MAG: HAD family hydrolase [Candidatus Coproplasma sp.]